MKPRAFKIQDLPVDSVVINNASLNTIKDIAMELVKRDFKGSEHILHRNLFQALRDYMVMKGATPNFTVEL